jgi:hypothetical protein
MYQRALEVNRGCSRSPQIRLGVRGLQASFANRELDMRCIRQSISQIDSAITVERHLLFQGTHIYFIRTKRGIQVYKILASGGFWHSDALCKPKLPWFSFSFDTTIVYFERHPFRHLIRGRGGGRRTIISSWQSVTTGAFSISFP